MPPRPGCEFAYVTPQAASDYANTLESMIAAESPDLVVTVGFRMGDATARVGAQPPGHPLRHRRQRVQPWLGVRGDGR